MLFPKFPFNYSCRKSKRIKKKTQLKMRKTIKKDDKEFIEIPSTQMTKIRSTGLYPPRLVLMGAKHVCFDNL